MQRVLKELNFMASKAITDMAIKKSPHWESNPGHPHCRQTCYQLNYHGQCKYAYFYETYEAAAKKVENKTVYYTETAERQHLIFWPGS
jgi:hypothetical protein